MPNIKSAKKRVELSQKNYLRNKANRSALKTALKKANVAIDENAADKDVAYKNAVSAIDTSVTKGILHKNTAAHKKSALAKKLNKAQ